MNNKQLFLSTMTVLSLSSFAGDLKLDMSTKLGLTIQSPVGDISACSRISAVEPPWEQVWYYNQKSESTFTNSFNEDGEQCVSMSQVNYEKLKINEYTAVANGNKVKIYFNAELTEDLPTDFEYSAINVMDYLLLDGTYKATLANGDVVSGIVDPEILHYETMIPDVKKVEFESQYGKLIITVTKGIGLNVDVRRDHGFEGFSCFWIGRYELPFALGEVFESEIELEFIQNKDVIVPTPIPNTNAPLIATENSELIREVPPYELPVMPTIKEQTMLPEAALTLGDKLNLELNFEADTAEVEKLTTAINRIYGKIAPNGKANLATTIQAKVGSEFDGLKSPEQPDGYVIQITTDAIKMVSLTPRGVYYAVQTLRSLVKDGQIQAQNIVDYPSMEFRGLHFFADSSSLELHGKMVEDVFGRYKINNIVYEIEYAAWDNTKEVHWPKAMKKDDIREFLKICEANYIEVSPLFNTLGHFDWYFSFGQNLEFAEDPDLPYAYNVAHPELYPRMAKLMDEILEVFGKPTFVHIGHDEVDARGRYPYRPENVERGIADLVISDIMFYYNYLAERDIKVMIWHDMVMSPKESSNGSGMGLDDVKKYRDMLPRDIVITDWNYSGTKTKSKFPCLQLLMDEGFVTLGCSWYMSNNIENMAIAVDKAKAWGLLGTTWAGYFTNDIALKRNFYQFATYIRVASWAWNTSHEANEGREDFLKEFAVITNEMWPQPDKNLGNSGKMLNLDSAVNIEISAEANPFMNSSDMNLNQVLKAGEVNYVGNMAFDISEVNGSIGAVAINSNINRLFPNSVTLDMNALECQYLYFLHSNLTDSGSLGMATAIAKMVYTDGTVVGFDILNGYMIGTLGRKIYSYVMKPEQGTEVEIDGENVTLIYGTWTNPYPEKQIKTLTISTGSLVRPYYLFGISAQ